MSFNRNDLQGDDDFNFDDDFDFDSDAGGTDDFKFDDEPTDIGLGDDDGDDGGFGFEGEDMPELGDDGGDGGEQRGTSRTFVILAAVMILLFVLGLAAVVLISLNTNNTPNENQLTASAIVDLNNTTVAQLAQTQTAAPLLADSQTQEALQIALQLTQTAGAPTETPRPPTITPTFTVTPAPALDETQLAATNIVVLTDQAIFDLTQTALAASPTPPQPSVNDVALTATALVAILAPNPNDQGGGGVPTQEFITTPGGLIPTALPQTGFFDDLAAGNANAGLIALLALGLVGVIGISRYLRTSVNK